MSLPHSYRMPVAGRIAAGLVATLLSAAVPAAQSTGCATLAPVDWLLGTWSSTNGKDRVTEEWRRVSEATFEGEGVTYALDDGARKGSESLRLVAMGPAVFYLAKVAHNNYPVAFALTACAAGRLVFENPAHDFPRRLEYTFAPPDRMTVHVSDGAAKGYTLEFRHAP